MDKSVIITKLTIVFRNVFSDDSIVLSDSLTANDIDKWDSLTHMILISEIESTFSVKFKLKDLNKMKNVGEMIDMIINKINEAV